MRIHFILFLAFSAFALSAQYSAVGLSEKNINRMASGSKNALLYVVIDNEKDPSDAALVNAVKKYWKHGSFKYISKTEFYEQGQKDALLLNTFYLAESYDEYNIQGTNSLEISSALKRFHSGVFSLSLIVAKEPNPKAKITDGKKTEAIRMKFDLRPSASNTKDKVIDGYFDLMIKYFNNEILFCQNFKTIKDVKKEDKDGIVYFNEGMSEVQNKDILLTKEQVTKMQPKDKKESKRVTAADAVAQFNNPKNVFTVFPEDIKLALNKGDGKVLIYSNDMLLSAADGAVIAATNIYAETADKKDGFFLMALGVFALSLGAGFLMK